MLEPISSRSSCLLIIDPQERLMKAVEKPERVVSNMVLLLECAKVMDIPVIATTQYKKGLGPIVPELERHLENAMSMDKVEFDCFLNEDFRGLLNKLPACVDTMIICGVEAHICVFQTAISSLKKGFKTWVVTDAISSRKKSNKKWAIRLLNDSSIACATTEMIIYQWLKRADTPEFKSMLTHLK